MHRANGSSPPFLERFFFFQGRNVFFNISSSLQENSWEANSSTFSLRLFIIKSHSQWQCGVKFLLLHSQALLGRRAGRLLLPSLCLCTSPKTDLPWASPLSGYNLYQGVSPGRFQGFGGHRLAVTLADGAMDSSAFFFLFKSSPVHKDWQQHFSTPPPSG